MRNHLQECNERRAEAARLSPGLQFGALTTTGICRRTNGVTKYEVVCDCGAHKFVTKSNLQGAKSCGCLTRSIISAAMRRHGDTDSPTWKTWKSMLDRCYLKSHKSYRDYGGRGITVSKSWMVYENFLSDMGKRPAGTQINRINNEGNYRKGNCAWSTCKENANNRRSSHFLKYRGERLTVSQWSQRLSGSDAALRKRLERGWSVKEALTLPFKRQTNSRTAAGSIVNPQRHGASCAVQTGEVK